MKSELTPKQAMFVKEYLVDLNATQAAIRAGYSVRTAMEQGYQLLQKTSVSSAIQENMDKRSESVDISAEDVLQSIKSIRNKTVQAEKWNEALKANEMLGKHLRLFIDKIEASGPSDGPIHFIVERVIVEPTKD